MSIKGKYYNIAKEKTSTIEEIDCLIEEYKNIKKINIPNTCALIFSFGSLFLITITSLFSSQAGLHGVIYSKLMDFALKYPEEANANIDFKDLDIPDITQTLMEILNYLLWICIGMVIVGMIYNNFNQKRLSGFYKYKRELLRERNETH